ncbi:type IV secretory pathway TraG/TraD family ATPase VirD4 [Bradyrhizobium sp. GM5.1]
MVSRQETSCPLLTPGEVMQLSSKEAIVMVSGLHPLRATKVRYHEDPITTGPKSNGPSALDRDRRQISEGWEAA